MPSNADRADAGISPITILDPPQPGDVAPAPATSNLILALFGAGLCAGALLMFVLEPMVAKMVLPRLGGAPAVWNTCVVFFQGMLLFGYAYAHAAPRWLGLRRHAAFHIGVLIVSTLVLPTALEIGSPNADLNPVAWLLWELIGAIGLPFFLLATTAPLLQRWFSQTRHAGARDPYFLYAASNFGSLVGLLLYPAVVEPLFSLRTQAGVWKYAYVGFVLTVIVCSLAMLRHRAAAADVSTSGGTPVIEARVPRVSARRRISWIALSFAPSSLMLAVTTFISTDIAAVPLLWVVPLALYLLTFILAFGSSLRYPWTAVDRTLPLLLLFLVLFVVLRIGGPIWLVVPTHLAVFFLAALVCHRALAGDRPDASHLTEFYLLIAVGGVLGSLFNTLAAPMLFNGVVEYPLVLLLVCLLRNPQEDGRLRPAWRIAAPVLAGLATLGILLATANVQDLGVRFGLLGIPAMICFSVSRTRIPFAAALAAVLLASSLYPDELGRVLHAERTFFGHYKVRLERDGTHRTLAHGTTLHGVQSVGQGPLEALSYYHATGPLGDVFSSVPIAGKHPHIGVVGLGVGSVAVYRRPSQKWTFFEIDPAVERIARRDEFFTYLSECGAACDVVIGDARQSLANSSTEYGVLVLDAFSSDAIPIHLVTREALRLYLERLARGGVLAFHISNRHLDLEPVLANLAQREQIVSYTRRDRVTEKDADGKTSSDWLVMARRQEDLGPLLANKAWKPSTVSSTVDLWTDDFSNVITLLLRK